MRLVPILAAAFLLAACQGPAAASTATPETLEAMLKAAGRDFVIVTGAWTNMSIEHTARTGADKGFYMVVPEDCCSTMNAEWHIAAVNYAIQNVAMVTCADDLIAALS